MDLVRNSMREKDELLTSQEVAAWLNVKQQTLAVWRTKRLHLPYIKVGATVRYRKKDIEKHLAEQKVI